MSGGQGGVPGYSKHTAATGEWSTTALIGENGLWARLAPGDLLAHSQQPVAISRSPNSDLSPNGDLWIAWSYQNELILTKQVESGWSAQQVIPFPCETREVAYNLLDLAFIERDPLERKGRQRRHHPGEPVTTIGERLDDQDPES